MALDIGAPHAAETAVRRTVSVFGRIDSLLNNAGVMDPIGPIARLDLTAWRRSFEINLFAALALTVEALPHLRAARGRVVTTVTALAHRPVRSLGAYSASKAAVLQATRVLAKEEDEVVCCAYSPGPVDTGMMAQLRDGGEGAIPEEETAGFRQMYEQGRLATAADAGRVLAWLALHATDEHRGQMVERGDRNVQAASASWLAKG
jgi:NAD(P)-dependent dehydrogenase (short-subunit alcohol dehydrogenase family)